MSQTQHSLGEIEPTSAEWSCEAQLDHLAILLAKEYVEVMKDSEPHLADTTIEVKK